jgi:hypothetical protein
MRREIKACQIGLHCCSFRVSAAHDSTVKAPLAVLIRLLSCIRLVGGSAKNELRLQARMGHCCATAAHERVKQPFGGRGHCFCSWPNKSCIPALFAQMLGVAWDRCRSGCDKSGQGDEGNHLSREARSASETWNGKRGEDLRISDLKERYVDMGMHAPNYCL